MKQGLGIYYFAVFKTTAPDGSAFFGITRTQNPSYGADSQPISYMGNGPKLIAKAKQFGGLQRFKHEVMQMFGTHPEACSFLDRILTTETLADPMCLNMPQPVTNAKISESLSGMPKSEEHKQAISSALQDNENALGHIKSEEAKEAISEHRGKMKWWHCKETGEEIQLGVDEDGISGFELGRLPKEFAKNFKKDRKSHVPPHIASLND